MPKITEKVKPFLKWAGGKTQLLPALEPYFPFTDKRITKYAEPFVGGGAVLFHILNKYDIKDIYISDVNSDLIDSYITIRDNIDSLVTMLHTYEDIYLRQDESGKKHYFLKNRSRFNELKLTSSSDTIIEKSALMIFLNHTCFNGLYRVNSKGLYNVPAGKYKNPSICDEANLRNISQKLSTVTIVCAPYYQSESFIDETTFVYFDPPYRPLTQTANFTAYTEYEFGDSEQKALALYYDKLCKKGALCLLSNSDPKNYDPKDNFFDDLYSNYNISRVYANRMINSNASARGKITEILVSNNTKQKGEGTVMFLEMSKKEFTTRFEEGLLNTNRGYNYYVDWTNILGLKTYQIEIHALDILIRCEESDFKNRFTELIQKLPNVIEVFPYLFALSKAERDSVVRNGTLKILGSEIDSDDYGIFNFNGENLAKNCSQEKIDEYYHFFVEMGLKSLFQNLLEKSVMDYIIGVLVGLDSNGRKNRGGAAFELACEPIIRHVCEPYGLKVLTQKKFKFLHETYGMHISNDEANRKADFIILNSTHTKCMNIEVNFYNGGGSKPEEIIDAYISRQNDLAKLNIGFALITDGNCWKGTTNQLSKGLNHLNYLMNYNLAKSGMLDEIIKKEFEV